MYISTQENENGRNGKKVNLERSLGLSYSPHGMPEIDLPIDVAKNLNAYVKRCNATNNGRCNGKTRDVKSFLDSLCNPIGALQVAQSDSYVKKKSTTQSLTTNNGNCFGSSRPVYVGHCW